jgi:hypothetical protein
MTKLEAHDPTAHAAALMVYEDGLTWPEAAKSIGNELTADGLRKRVARAFEAVRAGLESPFDSEN